MGLSKLEFRICVIVSFLTHLKKIRSDYLMIKLPVIVLV